MSKEEALREAEAFVRRALARLSDEPVDEAEIRAAAEKVAQTVLTLPGSPEHEEAA
jgi:hypothetical protein